jgi:hypothetical protein
MRPIVGYRLCAEATSAPRKPFVSSKGIAAENDPIMSILGTRLTEDRRRPRRPRRPFVSSTIGEIDDETRLIVGERLLAAVTSALRILVVCSKEGVVDDEIRAIVGERLAEAAISALRRLFVSSEIIMLLVDDSMRSIVGYRLAEATNAAIILFVSCGGIVELDDAMRLIVGGCFTVELNKFT